MKVYQGAAIYVASVAYRQQRNCLFARSGSHNSGRNITAKVITHQLALPALQEVASMLTGAAGAEVINDRRGSTNLASGVGPNIGTVGFLRTWREHLHRCFIGVDDLLPEHHIAQCVDQRLQLHAGNTHPLSQG
jgi:hypothetical protein